jgi:peptide/nickel transport system permease protein
MYLSIMPYYWFGMILIYVFGVALHWFPLSGAYSRIWLKPQWDNLNFILDVLHHYALPFLSLIAQGIGGWALGMRASVASQVRSAYTLYMRNLGFSFKKLRERVERNAILPNFTWLPMSFSGLVGQTLLVETVFGYPGIGSLMYDAAFSLDYPMLEATFLITMLIVLVGNLICDIIYGLLDPRIGSRYVSEERQ